MGDLIFLLFVLALGIDLGAGLYETRIVVPLWSRVDPAEMSPENPYVRIAIAAGTTFWSVVTPVVGILSLASLGFALTSAPPHRTLRILSTIAELCVIATTLAYFIPTLKGLFLQRRPDRAPESTRATVQRWVRLSYLRVALSIVAWCVGLVALAG